ncbi:MAG: O-antigen ligase family protein [Mariprofundaceae bacterium]|nr:O-antigen ligase family protein [Mariprofundaceae bacterium]
MKNLRSFFFKHPFLVLVLFIGPFSNTPLLSVNILGLPGMKVFNLLSLALMLSWILKGGRIIHLRGTIETKAMLFLFAIVFLYSIEFFRSLSNYDLIDSRYLGRFPDSPLGFFFSYWVKNVLYIIPFVYILQHIHEKIEANVLLMFLMASYLCFDSVSMYAGYGVATSGLDREALLLSFMGTLGMHYNNASTLIMIGIPIAMGIVYQFGIKYSGVLLFMFISLFLAGSRGAMVGAIAGCIVVFLMGNKMSKKLFFLILIIFPMVLFSDSLGQFLTGGVSDGSADEMSSGRMSSMWVPIMNELFGDAYKLFFGLGLLGIIQTDAYVFDPFFFQAVHAHNAYINLLLNAGLVAFIPFLVVVFIFIKRSLRQGQAIAEPAYYGLIGSVVAYLAASFFGRHFLLDFDNMLLFPIIALIVVYIRLEKLRDKE